VVEAARTNANNIVPNRIVELGKSGKK